jgi:signal transduction histidine kinase/DNA-binding response OmpR family regulator
MQSLPSFRRVASFELPVLRRLRDAVLKAREAEPLEFEQTLIRYAIGFVITAYMASAYAIGSLQGRPVQAIAAVLAGAWLFSFAGLYHLIRLPRYRIERRSIVMVADAMALSLLLGLGGETAAIFAPVYLWATLGNGLLFGLSYMYGAIAANLGGFAIMAVSTSFWREAWQISAGMGAAIVIMPLYVSRLMGNFREVMIAAQAASRAKTEFISMISHELRTPLNAIVGLAQISKMTATSAKERFSAISTELAAGRLLRMVDTILKFQRIESGTAERFDRDFDILDNLNEVRAIIEPLARQKGLHCHTRFTSSLPVRLRSDPDHVQTIILNLMANAVKYTRHGEVLLDIGLLRGASGQKLRIAVRDTGDGIAPDVQLRIFERFVRGEREAVADEPGVGLGLSMCKSLVELHGGTIGCESSPGEGSLFWAELPVARAGDGPEQAKSAAASPAAPILWIGTSAPPPALAGLIARTVDEGEILGSAAQNKAALALHVLVADSESLSPEIRTALTQLRHSERPPSLVLVNGRRGEPDELDHLATAAAYGSADAETLELIATAARWQSRLAPPVHAEAPGLGAVPASAANGPLAVLVADDNALNREVMRRMLEIDGHKVTVAETGDDALRVLLDGEVEIALLDISMPGLSGIEVCRNYRTCIGSARPIPIIGVTAASSDELRESCLAAGMADLLGRPVTIQQLRDALARYRVTDTTPAAPSMAADDILEAGSPIADAQRMELLKDLFGEEKLHTQFLPSFRRDLGAGIERLRDAIRRKSPILIRDAIHAIKSSASTAGAKEVLAIALGFPLDATEAEIDAFEARIEAAYRRYCEHLDGERPASSETKRSAAS